MTLLGSAGGNTGNNNNTSSETKKAPSNSEYVAPSMESAPDDDLPF
jgi:hypothetical protein